jgi:hypothetical protein
MSGHVHQEADKIESGRIIMVGVTALTIFALGIVWAIWIQRESTGGIRTFTPEQVPVGKQDEIGIVYQPQFELGDFASRQNAKFNEHLSSVGWVDQAAHKVHIPIERAMKDYVADAERNGGKL